MKFYEIYERKGNFDFYVTRFYDLTDALEFISENENDYDGSLIIVESD